MTLYKDIMAYFDKVIYFYGMKVEYIVVDGHCLYYINWQGGI